ncbi:MAG: peptidase domain-containing ABC transporter [Bacteroidetes bacterium]|nr:peptidase domain-containing ABC transporter [Bacteroidota bacterium]
MGIFSKSFPNVRQLGAMDCGPTCIKMIAKYYGRDFSVSFLREKCFITKLGVNLLGISEAAETIGLRSTGVKINYDGLLESKPFPCILHWKNNHFVVLYKMTKNKVYISDPAMGLMVYNKQEFLEAWGHGSDTGFALFIEPSTEFYESEIDGVEEKHISSTKFLLDYMRGYTPYFVQIFLGMLIGSIIMLFTPFLTQSIVDKGINGLDINFINLVLIGQVVLFLGGAFVEIIRSWILLHIGSRINVSLISDFLKKLLSLKIQFFESHLIGDILRRVEDHKRIERLLTVTSLSTVFSIINLILFSIILVIYDLKIFLVFFAGSLLSILWVTLFLKQKKKLDFRYFETYSKNYNKLIEIIKGVEEIKLSNSNKQKRWEWEENQARIFKINTKALSVEQLQNNGANIINQLTTILITYFSAKAVVNGHYSLGAMFAINMIVGQLKSPINQIIEFIPLLQEAKLGLDRILEIHQQEQEETHFNKAVSRIDKAEDLVLENLSFSYTGDPNNLVLKNINLTIPAGKTTAIVGSSGSGKSTLMKLLLRFYEPSMGKIMVGSDNMNAIFYSVWRGNIGVVMQEGKVFSETIANNIALGLKVDMKRVVECAKQACIDEFITESLPLGYNTQIGDEGVPMSLGQKQRILLARAFYKNPNFMFLDEATSALDAKNERLVVQNLEAFCEKRSVVVIAHRLSTVVNADQIVVLNRGEIAEVGTHKELVAMQGIYYGLVKNQIELGS